ncbi:MAG: hypothetical protein JNK61_07790 [Bacteroidia bacterium]|nr:hypothetical protein [Bacteroidia bacterium]
MKKFFTICLIILIGSSLHAQVAPTTEDEYNYATTGYKIQLQMKLPEKKGYQLQDFATYENADRKCIFKKVLREKETLPCAIIIIYSRPRINPEYFCIPTADADQKLWDKYFLGLRSDIENEEERNKFLSQAISVALAKK